LFTSDVRPKKLSNKTTLLLVGDATIGVHFFSGSGINVGVKTAKLAAKLICGEISENLYTKKMAETINYALKVSQNAILKGNANNIGECVRNGTRIPNSRISSYEACLVLSNGFIV
jgi:flavin-dependent dehydrogenase